MDNPSRSRVERQVRRVRRRLFVSGLLHGLALGWSAALLLCAAWFLVRPFLAADGGWLVPSTLLGLGTVGGAVLAWLRAPNFIAAGLALDERFGLRERVTTLLTLPGDQADTPAGQALLHDVGTHVADLPIASRFPIQLSRSACLLPTGALSLAVAAFFLAPLLGQFSFRHLLAANPAPPPVDAKEIEQQLDNLRKVSLQPKNPELEPSKEMKELEAEWDKLVKQPLDAKSEEKVRERVNEMRNLEQKMKERISDLKSQANKADQLKKLLEKLSEQGNKKLKDGLAKDFEDALSKGDFQKAKEVLDKLSKDLKNNKIGKQEQKELAEQFKDIQEKLKRLVEKDRKLQQLKKDFEEGRIDKEQLDREMEQFKELQELANLLGECHDCLGLDAGQAAARLGKLANEFEQMELSEQELIELLGSQEALDDALQAMLDALGDCDCEGNGLGKGRFPGRKRPISPDDPDGKVVNERQKSEVNPSSQQRIVGYTKGGNFSRIPAKQVDGAFRQSAQEAPEAIERQRIPEDAADIARGYFRKLGNQK